MPAEIKAWIQLASNEPLPLMRRTSLALRRLSNHDGPEQTQIVDVIQQDCGLAIQLLRRMSELRSRRQVVEVTTLEHAVVMLGADRVLNLVKELPVVEDLLDGDRLLGYMRVAARSFHAARQALDWARMRGDSAPEELSLAAFLHDLAELVLWRFGKDEMPRLERLSRVDKVDEIGPERTEIEILGFEALALGRELARRWRLPRLVHTCQNPISALEPRTLGPIFAAKLARAVQYGWYHPGALELVNMVGDYLDMSSEQGVARVHAEAVNTSRVVDFHGVTPVAAGLLHSGKIPHIIANPNPEPRKKRPGLKRQAPQSEVSKAQVVTVSAVSNPMEYHRSLKRLNERKLGVHAIVKTALDGMHIGLGLPRVFFTILTSDRRALVLRYSVGVADGPRFKGILLSLTPPNLITRMMAKPQALWVNEGNADKIWPYLPQRLRGLVKVKAFFIMSVFANGKPLGMFYADQDGSEGVLDQTRFMAFKSLCSSTGQALTREHDDAKAQK